MGLSTPPPTWATVKNKPTTVAGLGLSDFNASAIAAQAGGAVGSVGTLALMTVVGVSTSALSAGGTVSGSSCRYTNMGGAYSGTPAGTWRVMGHLAQQDGANNWQLSSSLLLRIS